MRLEDHLRIIADPATVEDFTLAVGGLTEVGQAYVILSDYSAGHESAGTVGEDFIVERRDGCAGEHYRGNRRVTAAELVAMLEGHLRGSTTWSHVIAWHQVDPNDLRTWS